MNILTLVPDVKAPSCRFRILQYLGPLAAEGINLEVVELSRQRWRRWRLFRAAGKFDAVLLHRKLLNRFDYRALRKHARRLIYDFDDALMYRDSNAPDQQSRTRKRKFQRLVTGADLIIAGNEYLAARARRRNRNTRVIPTALDFSGFPAEPVAGPGTVIGWMGTKSNFPYLSLVRPALREITRNQPSFRFVVVSDGVPDLPDVRFEHKPWSGEKEVSDLLGFDVGIMPLFDDPWARGKCALKIIQYFAAFRPVVCSPVGANREVVRDGVNGYFARGAEEWRDGLRKLLGSAELREKLGRAGRKLVEEKYSLSVAVPQMTSLLKETVG